MGCKFSNLLEKETLQTDGEIAIYWFASEYHSGQSSNLYKALCTIDYNPGRMINNVLDENEIVCMIFNFLVEKYDPDGDNFIVIEVTLALNNDKKQYNYPTIWKMSENKDGSWDLVYNPPYIITKNGLRKKNPNFQYKNMFNYK